jgi:hypothetical protein
MEQVKVVFGSNWKPASLFIKLFTWSRWCHCGIVDGEYIIDTTLATGCRRILITEWVKHYSKYEVMDFPTESKEGCIEKARSFVGTAYDRLGIFSYVFYRDFSDKTKFFCSELIAECMGIKYKPWSISPAWMFKLGKSLKGWLYE